MTVGEPAGRTPRKSGTYHSPRRAEQAAATRAAIIAAAARQFAELGYAATTMAGIATEARVAVKSVYTLADKAQLMLLAVDYAIAGDAEPGSLAERPGMRAVLEARDPAVLIRRAARFGAEMLIRLFPVYRAFEQAAATDAGLREHWQQYQQRRYQDTVRIIAAVADLTPLRPGLSRKQAAETLWALTTWHPVALLVEERGWTQQRVAAWLADVLSATLLPAGPTQSPSR